MVPVRKLLSFILALSFTIRQKVKLNALECEYGVPVMFPYSFKCRLTDTEIFALRYCLVCIVLLRARKDNGGEVSFDVGKSRGPATLSTYVHPNDLFV